MNLVTLEHVGKRFSERVLLDDVELRLNAGDRIGLIGVNGSGKTTLLRIVAGLEPPDSGTVTTWGGVRVAYLPQEPVLDAAATALEAVVGGDAPRQTLRRAYDAASRRLAEAPDDAAAGDALARLAAELDRTGGWAAEAEAKALLTRLGVADVDARVSALSGGGHKRVALARALIDPADLLVLDEPTNHIDAETVAWLEQHLVRRPGALLMVTHDRYFLDRVANRIVELDRRQLVGYAGNYRAYLEQRTERHARLAQREEAHRAQLRRELAWLQRGAKARSTKQKARIQRIDALQQIRHDLGEDRVALALAGRRLGKQVLSARGLVKAFDGRTVLAGVDLDLGPGDRLGIVGPNGAGKSTLLDVLAGRLAADAGTVAWGETVAVGYFDQRSAALRDDLKLIDYVDQEAPLIRMADGSQATSARMLEWLLFPGPQQHARIGSLSGGERRRLYLLRTLLHQPNVLLLDEPTNDLDIETLQVLESFLDAFTGTVVVVSHDRYFLDRTVDQLAVLEDGRLHTGYPTPFDTFLRIRAEQRARRSPAVPAPPPPGRGASDESDARGAAPTTAAPAAPAPPPRKRSWKTARTIEALEGRIAELEARQAALAADIGAAGADHVRLAALSDALAEVNAAIDDATAQWLALEEGEG